MGTTVPNWNEVTGDWGIVDGRLCEHWQGGGTYGAKIICTEPVPERSAGEMAIGVDVYDPLIGDYYILYLCCLDEETTGSVDALFLYEGGADWVVSIRVDGSVVYSINMTGDPVAELTYRLWACTDLEVGMIRAGVVALGQEYAWEEREAGDGRYAGLGHLNMKEFGYGAQFDNFTLTELRTETIICYDCFCWCLGFAPRKRLIARFIDTSGRADCLSTDEFEMDAEWWTSQFAWYGEFTHPPTAAGGLETTMTFRLTCAADDDDDEAWPGKNFLLDFVNDTCCVVNTNQCGTYQPIAEESTCEPIFSLVFGPFNLGYMDLTCNLCYPVTEEPHDGSYKIVITEEPYSE